MGPPGLLWSGATARGGRPVRGTRSGGRSSARPPAPAAGVLLPRVAVGALPLPPAAAAAARRRCCCWWCASSAKCTGSSGGRCAGWNAAAGRGGAATGREPGSFPGGSEVGSFKGAMASATVGGSPAGPTLQPSWLWPLPMLPAVGALKASCSGGKGRRPGACLPSAGSCGGCWPACAAAKGAAVGIDTGRVAGRNGGAGAVAGPRSGLAPSVPSAGAAAKCCSGAESQPAAALCSGAGSTAKAVGCSTSCPFPTADSVDSRGAAVCSTLGPSAAAGRAAATTGPAECSVECMARVPCQPVQLPESLGQSPSRCRRPNTRPES